MRRALRSRATPEERGHSGLVRRGPDAEQRTEGSRCGERSIERYIAPDAFSASQCTTCSAAANTRNLYHHGLYSAYMDA